MAAGAEEERHHMHARAAGGGQLRGGFSGVLAAIALWSRERVRDGAPALPVYFIGVGEKLEDLQTFSAREFAQALLN